MIAAVLADANGGGDKDSGIRERSPCVPLQSVHTSIASSLHRRVRRNSHDRCRTGWWWQRSVGAARWSRTGPTRKSQEQTRIGPGDGRSPGQHWSRRRGQEKVHSYAWLCPQSIQLKGRCVFDPSAAGEAVDIEIATLLKLRIAVSGRLRTRPSPSIVRDFQSIRFCAREMSGRRWRGSFPGQGLWTMREWWPVASRIPWACQYSGSQGREVNERVRRYHAPVRRLLICTNTKKSPAWAGLSLRRNVECEYRMCGIDRHPRD